MEVRKLLVADLLSQENNETISSAQVASVVTSTEFVIEGHIGDGMYGTADVDMFQITLAPGEKLSADIDSYVLDDGSYWSYGGYSHLRLFDSYGGEVADSYYYETNDPDSGYGGDPVLEYTSEYGGTYYLGVSSDGNDTYDPDYGGSGYGGSSFDYQLELNVDDASSGAPEVDVYNDQYGGSIILDDYGSYAFGTTDLGTDLTRTFRVTNSGTDTLTLGSISTTSSFSVDSSFGSTSLAPGADTTFTIRFDADSVGTFNGTITFSTNDSDENPFNFDLSGTVTSSDIGDTSSTAQLVSLTPGIQTQIDSSIGDGMYGTADVDMFQITLAPGETLSADIDSYVLDDGSYWSYGGYSHLRLFDSYGGEVADSYYYETNDPDSGYGGDPVLEYMSEYGGIYYLGVSSDGNDTYDPDYGGSGYGGSSFDYQLELNVEDAPSGAPEVDVYNDQYGGSIILDDYGSYAFGTTDLGTDLTRTFRVTNSGTGTLTLGSISTTSSFSVDSSFGSTSLAPGADTTFTIRFDANSVGTFNGTISFSTNDSDENPFNFDLSGTATSSDIGDTRSTAQSVSLTPGIQTQIDSSIGDGMYGTADVDMFQITLAPGETLSADIDSYVLDDGSYWSYGGYSHLRLFDSYGGEVADSYYYETNDPDSGYGGDPVLEYTSEYGGTYYLGVSSDGNDTYDPDYGGSGYGGSSFDYQLELNVDDNYGGVPEITVYDDEYGGNSIVDGTGSIAFGTTELGTPITKTFRVTNDGDATLTLGNIVLPIGYSVYSSFGTTSLSPGQSTTFQLQLVAANASSYSGTISFATNDGDEDPFDFYVTGNVEQSSGDPEISVLDSSQTTIIDDVTTVDFGSTNVGTPIDKFFTITNDGTNNLTLDSSSMSVPSGWQVTQSFSTTVTPGNSTNFTLRFLATAAGTSSGTVSFLNNDADEGTFSFDVTAVANVVSAPEITVLENSSSLQSGSSTVYFGNVSEQDSATRTIEIRNDGTQTLTLDTGSIQVPSGYQIVTLPAGSVSPGGSTTLVLKLESTALGNYSGTVQFTSNDSDESPFSFYVNGDVVAHVPDMSINDQYTQEGNTSTFTVTLSDASSATISVDYTTIGNTATAGIDYTHVSGSLTFLPGETTKTIEVPILSDTDTESEELYSLQLSNVSGANLLDSVGEGHIVDDLPPNEAPAVASPLVDLTIDEDSATTTIDLSSVFDDANLIYGDVLTYTAISTDTDLVTVAVVGNELHIVPNRDQNGSATITVTATDSEGLQVSDSFLLTVTPANDAPKMDWRIPDQFMEMDEEDRTISLSNFFLDVDIPLEGDLLSYTIANTNQSLLTTTESNGTLTLSLASEAFGEATITITASDLAGAEISDSFRVVVEPSNTTPTVSTPIGTVDLDEDFGEWSLDLSMVFSDSDVAAYGDSLLYVVLENDNLLSSELPTATVYLMDGKLYASARENQSGESSVTIRAIDSLGEFVDETFTLKINSVNDAPEISGAIADVSTTMNASPTVIDLSTLFSDVDIEVSADSLAISVASVSDPSLLGATVNGDQLTITPQLNQIGQSTITIRAIDLTGEYIDYVLPVEVLYESQAPTVSGSIADQTVTEDSSDLTIDFSSLFTDADIAFAGDWLNYEVSVDDPSLVIPSLTGTSLSLSFIPDATGITNVTVTATDQEGLTATEVFQVTIAAVNDAPVVANPVSLSYTAGVTNSEIDLAVVFQDADLPFGIDTLSYQVISETNTTLATSTIQGGVLSLHYDTQEVGSKQIVVRATDGAGVWVETTIDVTIAASVTDYYGKIDDIALVEDTGSSGDLVTYNAGIVGKIYTQIPEGHIEIEFDHNGDEMVDGVKVFEKHDVLAYDYFFYDPRFEEESLYNYVGQFDLNFRTAEIDSTEAVRTYRDWELFQFTLDNLPTSSVVATVDLTEDDGANANDKITSNATITGNVPENYAGSRIEFDLNADGIVDADTYSDGEGNFHYTPLLMQYGATTIAHRVVHWSSDAGSYLTGLWTNFDFTLEPEAGTKISEFHLSGEIADEYGLYAQDVETTSPLLIGQIDANAEKLSNVRIEFDHDADDVADGTTFTFADGSFEYLPRSLSEGQVTVRARSVRLDYRTDQEVYGEWKSYTFLMASEQLPEVSQLRLLNDTGDDPNDGITYDSSLTGRLLFTADISLDEVFIEFDHDGDDSVDGITVVDANGEFIYQPPGLSIGTHTLKGRASVWSENLSGFASGTWTTITFTLESPVNNPATLESLGLFNDNGIDKNDGISTDGAISGQIANDGDIAYWTVEFDHDGDGTADGQVNADSTGQFLYVPLGVGQGTHTIQARVREWDYASRQFISANWQSYTYTIAEPINDVADITQFTLLSDTGSSQTDGITANPIIAGVVDNLEYASGLVIEFDHDGDGVVDGHTFADASGSFDYEPVALAYGQHTIRARAREWDYHTNEYLLGAWESLTFTFEDQANTAAHIVGVGLANDNGENPSDGITSDPTITGTIRNENFLAGVTIDIDTDSDGVADALTTTNQRGEFLYRLNDLSNGSVTLQARTREYDSLTGNELIGSWTVLSFTYAEDVNQAASIVTFGLSNDTGDAQDGITTDPTISGQIANDDKLDGLAVQLDTNNDGVVDQFVSTNSDGTFSYSPVGLVPGEQTIRVRVKEYDNHNIAVYSDWSQVTFTLESEASTSSSSIAMLQLLNDSGNSNADRATADATLTGSLSSSLGSGNITIEFDHDGDGIIDGTTFAQAGQSFNYLPEGLEDGFHNITARVVGTDDWRSIGFVSSSDPDSSETQALIQSYNALQTDLAGIADGYSLSLDATNLKFNSTISSIIDQFDSKIALATSSYESTMAAARSMLEGIVNQAQLDIDSAKAAAFSQFIVDMAAFSGDKTSFNFDGFELGDSPQAIQYEIKTGDELVTAPQFDSNANYFRYDHTKDPLYQSQHREAEQTRTLAIRNAVTNHKQTIKAARDNADAVIADVLRQLELDLNEDRRDLTAKEADLDNILSGQSPGRPNEMSAYDYKEIDREANQEKEATERTLIEKIKIVQFFEGHQWANIYDSKPAVYYLFDEGLISQDTFDELSNRFSENDVISSFDGVMSDEYNSAFDQAVADYLQAVSTAQGQTELESSFSIAFDQFIDTLAAKEYDDIVATRDKFREFNLSILEIKESVDSTLVELSRADALRRSDYQYRQEMLNAKIQASHQTTRNELVSDARSQITSTNNGQQQTVQEASNQRNSAIDAGNVAYQSSDSSNSFNSVSDFASASGQPSANFQRDLAGVVDTSRQSVLSEVSNLSGDLSTKRSNAIEEISDSEAELGEALDSAKRELNKKTIDTWLESAKQSLENNRNLRDAEINAVFDQKLAFAKAENDAIRVKISLIQDFEVSVAEAYKSSLLSETFSDSQLSVYQGSVPTTEQDFLSPLGGYRAPSDIVQVPSAQEFKNDRRVVEGGFAAADNQVKLDQWAAVTQFKIEMAAAKYEWQKTDSEIWSQYEADILTLNADTGSANSDKQASFENDAIDTQKGLQDEVIIAEKAVADKSAIEQEAVTKSSSQLNHGFEVARANDHLSKLTDFDTQRGSHYSENSLNNFSSFVSNIATSAGSFVDGFFQAAAGISKDLSNQLSVAQQQSAAQSADASVAAEKKSLQNANEAAKQMSSAALTFQTAMLGHESERNIAQFAAERDKAIQVAISLYNLHAGGGVEFEIGTSEESLTFSSSSNGYIANAKEYDVLSAEWAEYHRINNQYTSYTPPSTTLQEATDAREIKDLDAQVAYSKSMAAADTAYVTASETAQKEFAGKYVTATNEFADKVKQVSDQLAEKDKATLDEYASAVARSDTNATKTSTAAYQSYDDSMASERIGLESQTLSSENTHQENTTSNDSQLAINVASDHHAAMSAADFGNALSTFLIQQAANQLSFTQEMNTQENTYVQALTVAASSVASTLAPTATGFVSALAGAGKAALDGYANNSESFANAATKAATSADLAQIKASNAFAAASLKAGVLHYQQQIDAEAAAKIAFAQTNQTWVDAVAPAKKQFALDDDQQAYDDAVAAADSARESKNGETMTTQLTAIGQAISTHATSLGSAITTYSSAIAATETGYVDAIASAVTQLNAKDNSTDSMALNRIINAENAQASSQQGAMDGFASDRSAAQATRAGSLATSVTALDTQTTNSKFAYHQTDAADQTAAWQSLASTQPGTRADVGLAQAQGNQAYLNALQTEYSRNEGEKTSALQAYETEIQSTADASLATTKSAVSSYGSQLRTSSGNLEIAMAAAGNTYSEAYDNAQKQLYGNLASAAAALGSTLSANYVAYLKDATTAQIQYQIELYDDDLAAGAESKRDAAILALDLTQISKTADADLEYAKAAVGHLSTFNSAAIAADGELSVTIGNSQYSFQRNQAENAKNLGLAISSSNTAAETGAANAESQLITRLIDNAALHNANEADAQLAGVQAIDTGLNNPYTNSLVAQYTGKSQAATNHQLESLDWVRDLMASYGVYNSAVAGASGQYDITRENAIYNNAQQSASSAKQSNGAIASSYTTNAQTVIGAITQYQNGHAQAQRDYRVAVEQAERQFAADGNAQTRDAAVAAAQSALSNTTKQLDDAYRAAVVPADAQHQATVSKEDAKHANNVGRSKLANVESIANARVNLITTEADAGRTYQEAVADRDLAFAQFTIANTHDAVIDALDGFDDPWSNQAVATAAANQTRDLAIAQGIFDFEEAWAAATESRDVDTVSAERDRTVGEATAGIRRSVEQADLTAQQADDQADALETNPNGVVFHEAATNEVVKPGETPATTSGAGTPGTIYPNSSPDLVDVDDLDIPVASPSEPNAYDAPPNAATAEPEERTPDPEAEKAYRAKLEEIAKAMLGEKLAKEFATRHGTHALEKLARAGSWGWQVDVGGTTRGESGDFIDTTTRQIRVPFAQANTKTVGKSSSPSVMKRYELSLEAKADYLAELIDHQEITQYNTGFDEGDSSTFNAFVDEFSDHPGAQIAGGVVIIVVAVATLPVSGPLALSSAATFSITGAAQAAVVVGAGYTVVRVVDEGAKDVGRWTGHLDNDSLTPIEHTFSRFIGKDNAEDLVFSTDIAVGIVEVGGGIAGGIAAARARSAAQREGVFGFWEGEKVGNLDGYSAFPLYNSSEARKVFNEMATLTGGRKIDDGYRVLVTSFAHQTPVTRIIDGVPTVVVGPSFFQRYSKTQQVLIAAHEVEHVEDIIQFGIARYTKIKRISNATLELSVQNRAMARVMVGYERLGRAVPEDVMQLHNAYLYDPKSGWVRKLQLDWE